jgi:cell division protein FtsB
VSRYQKIFLKVIFAAMFGLVGVILFGDNGLMELRNLRGAHQQLVEANGILMRENLRLCTTIDRLQNDPRYVENVARRELGMVRSNEVIFTFGSGSVK